MNFIYIYMYIYIIHLYKSHFTRLKLAKPSHTHLLKYLQLSSIYLAHVINFYLVTFIANFPCLFLQNEANGKSEHVYIIIVVFGLILGGMVISFIFNCIRKIIRDQKIIRVSIVNKLVW